MSDDMFDSGQSGLRSSAMWLRLAEQIEGAIPDMVIAGDVKQAIQWACCAEACFWKATGESDAHDVKDVLAFDAALPASREGGENG